MLDSMKVKNYIFIATVIWMCLPELTSAQGLTEALCDGTTCSACHLVELGNRLIQFIISTAFLLFGVLAVWAGFGLVTSGGNPSALEDAKKRFTNAFVGLLIILSAGILVDTLIRGITTSTGGDVDGFGPWATIQCGTQSVADTIPDSIDISSDIDALAPGTPASVFVSGVSGVDEFGFPTCEPSDPDFPDCGPTIIASDTMNPVFNCSVGQCSSGLRPGAEALMQETLNGPFALLQANFGSNLVINDALAREGTNRLNPNSSDYAPNSRHFFGDAIDVSLHGMNNADRIRLFNEARNAGFTGFGFGRNILHIDRGTPRAWAYGNSTYGGQSVNSLISQATN